MHFFDRLSAFPRRILATGLLLANLPAPASPLAWTMAPVQFTTEDHTHAEIRFSLRNSSDAPLTINEVEPSCGCTVVEAPARPWTLPPRTGGVLVAQVDLRGKRGELHKVIRLITSAGDVSLPVKIQIPESPLSASRQQNLVIALLDAQAIFRGDCASCHAAPATDKTGGELYLAVCAICHEAHPRAEAVPDLQEATRDKTADYLRSWITEGKAGTLMPPFAKDKGGILDAAQIESLVDFLRTQPPTAR